MNDRLLEKKVLFLAPTEPNGRYKGGIASFASSICGDSYFSNKGFKFLPLSTCQVKRDAFSGGKLGFKNIKNFLKLKKEIKKELKTNSYKFVYINTSRNLALLKDLLLISKKYSKKIHIILHIHFADFNEVFHKNKIIRSITLKRLRKLNPTIISLSEILKKDLVARGFSENKIKVLRNYYNPSLSIIKNNACKNSLITNYLFIGAIAKRKGIDLLLEVFSELGDEYQLSVCGTPNEKDGEKIVSEYSNKSNVHFLGFVDGEDKQKILSNSDVFVLPTLSEGLPISILEAMFYGLGIVTTSVGAIPEIVNQKNGFIVEPKDKEMLKKSIIEYHENGVILEKHKKQNMEESKKFSYEFFRDSLINILSNE